MKETLLMKVNPKMENIKPVDPLLYSQLIHQKNIGFMKRKMHFNPGQF